MLKDPYPSKYKVVAIQKVEANIKINKSSSETFKKTSISIDSCIGMHCPPNSRSYTAQNCCFFGVGEAKNFLTRPNLCFPITFNILVKILSHFDPKIIRTNQLALAQYEYLRKEKKLL